MSLKNEINAIIGDASLSYEEKGKRLAKLVTKKEVERILPKPKEEIKLKEPLKPKRTNMRVLNLSIHDMYFEMIKKKQKTAEFRDYTDYYIKKCTYEEDGKRYLVPFDAITFYVGKSKSMTVALKHISCDGYTFTFYLGDILYPKE